MALNEISASSGLLRFYNRLPAQVTPNDHMAYRVVVLYRFDSTNSYS